MNRPIYTYALIKSLYDQGQDYIDSFWPFAIKVIPSDRFVDIEFIQKKLTKNYELEIPLHVLRTILRRANKKDYIDWMKSEKKYKLTEKGTSYLEKIETERQVERRINALLEDIKEFFKKGNLPLNIEQTHQLLLFFLQQNIEFVIQFISPSVTFTKLTIPKLNNQEDLLIKYFKYAEQQKPENYNTLQDMIFGSIISVVLYVEEPSEIIEIKKRKFRNRQIFLDTNFVFSILELRTPEFITPAKELFDLIRGYGFKLKVFNFTVNEICRVLGGFLTQGFRYPITINVNSLYSDLKRKGWTKTKAREFIMDIENILYEKGIEIKRTNIDLKTYKPKKEELRDLMYKYKPWIDSYHQNHDLAAIEKIKDIRGREIRRIEHSNACFLTSDAKLSKFNFMRWGIKKMVRYVKLFQIDY